MGLYHTKKFLHSKGNYQQQEKMTYQVGDAFASHISDKWLISTIYRELQKFIKNEISFLRVKNAD